MQVIENNELFSELSNEESANVSGGLGPAGAIALAGFVGAKGPVLAPGDVVTITAVAQGSL
jgi:lactobin A/cerein 7B family class IIb bacteriocin